MPGTIFEFEIVWECWVSQTFSAASVGWPISTHFQRFWHLLQTRHAKTLFCFCRASSLRLQICPKHFVVGMKLGARRKRSWNMVPLHHAKLSWQTNTTKYSSYMFTLVHLMAVHLGSMTTASCLGWVVSAVTEICRQVSALPWHLPQGAPVDLTQQPGPAPAQAGHCVAFVSIIHHSVCVASFAQHDATWSSCHVRSCVTMRRHVTRAKHAQQTCEPVKLSHTPPLSLSTSLSSLWSLGRPCWHLLLKLQLLLLLHSLTEIWQKRYLAESGIFSLIMVDPCWSLIILIIPYLSRDCWLILKQFIIVYWYFMSKGCKVWVTVSQVVFCIDLHCFLWCLFPVVLARFLLFKNISGIFGIELHLRLFLHLASLCCIFCSQDFVSVFQSVCHCVCHLCQLRGDRHLYSLEALTSFLMLVKDIVKSSRYSLVTYSTFQHRFFVQVGNDQPYLSGMRGCHRMERGLQWFHSKSIQPTPSNTNDTCQIFDDTCQILSTQSTALPSWHPKMSTASCSNMLCSNIVKCIPTLFSDLLLCSARSKVA